MRVFRNLDQLPQFNNAVITIGTFDGVHLGHQRIITRIIEIAKSVNGESIIVTFHPHPRLVIQPQDETLKLLQTTEEKIEVLRGLGVDNVVVVPFSRDFSDQDADAYIRDFLVSNFQPKVIVIGYDHKFGKNRQGDYRMLEQMKDEYGYALEEISQETLHDVAISSTKIREALNAGDVRLATNLAGHPYVLSGTVIRGQQRGRQLGYPTANIQINDAYKLIPASGVYAVKAVYDGKEYSGLLNIGFNPTFSGKERSIEVHILDFQKDIYGENLELKLMAYLRGEKKFDSIEALVSAIKKDEEKTRSIFSSSPK